MNIKLIKQLAEEIKIDWRIAAAIFLKESSGKGFFNDGTIKTRFEKGIYSGFVKVKSGVAKIHPALPGLSKEFICKHSVEELEMLSTSYGIAQVMGWHYQITLGYVSVEEMTDYYLESEDNQIKSFFEFCKKYRDGSFLNALREKNYKKIAQLYNGAGYAINKYDTALIANVKVADRLQYA